MTIATGATAKASLNNNELVDLTYSKYIMMLEISRSRKKLSFGLSRVNIACTYS